MVTGKQTFFFVVALLVVGVTAAQVLDSGVAAAVVYSTFVGGNATDVAHAATAGTNGSIWIGGRSCSPDLPFGSLVNKSQHSVKFFGQPLSPGFDPSGNFTGKFDCSGPADYLVFQSTFLRCRNYANISLARPEDVNPGKGPQDLYGASPTCGDGILYKVGADGTPLAASYLGGVGSERVTAMLVSKSNGSKPPQLWIAGEVCSELGFLGNLLFSSVTKGRCDAFAAILDEKDGNFVAYQIFGGSDQDLPTAMAEATDGGVWVVGNTISYPDFPRANLYNISQTLTTGQIIPYQVPFQAQPLDLKGFDIFVRKYSAEGRVLFSTVFGQNFTDIADAIAPGANGTVWVGGRTCNRNLVADNPLGFGSDPAFQTKYGEQCDAILMRWDLDGRLSYLSYLGGDNEERIKGLASDGQGGVWITGWTMSTNFPMVGGSQWPKNTKPNSFSSFLARVDAKGQLVYSTYLSGTGGEDFTRSVSVDGSGSLWLFGDTNSSSLPLEISRPAVLGAEGRPQGRAHHTFLAHGSAQTGMIDFTFVFGGDDEDTAAALALASDGSVWAVGSTASVNYPVAGDRVPQPVHGAQGQGSDQGLMDISLTKLQAPLRLRVAEPWGGRSTPLQAPTKPISPAVVAELVDSTGARATGLNLACRVVFNDTAAATSNGWTIPFPATAGTGGACVFDALQLNVPANATYQLRIEATLRFGVVLSTEFSISYRGCAPGEQRDRLGPNYSCISCPRGSTSLYSDATECQFCDDKKLDCQGGSGLFIRSGYWYPSLRELETAFCPQPVTVDCFQKSIYPCRPASACTGGGLEGNYTSGGSGQITSRRRLLDVDASSRRLAYVYDPSSRHLADGVSRRRLLDGNNSTVTASNVTTEAGQICAEGYNGPLCATCDGGYARTASGGCSKCRASSGVTVLILVAVFLATVLVVALLIYLPQHCAFDERDMADVFFRTLVNYFQFAGLFSALNVDWSTLLVGLFKVYGATSSAGIPWNDLECELGRLSDGSSVFYSRFLVTMMYPPIAALVAAVLLGGLYLTKRVKTFTHLYVGSVCAALYLLYPTITSSSLSIFHCVKLGSKWYLEGYTDVVCYEGRHLAWLLLGGVTSIILYVLGIPLLMFLVTLHYYRTGKVCEEERDVWRAFAFLRADIKEKFFFLEILGMLQKLLLVLITVFAVRDTLLQTLLGLLLIMGILLFRVVVNPYKQVSLYLADCAAYTVAFLTLYGSLYFRVTGVQDEDKLRALVSAVLFIINALLIGSLVFLTVLGYYKRWKSGKYGDILSKFSVSRAPRQCPEALGKEREPLEVEFGEGKQGVASDNGK